MSIYVALLGKIETLDTGCFERSDIPELNEKKWIALGHFDAMHTYKLDLDDKNLFQAIEQNNRKISKFQKDREYFYPMYMIPSDDADQFWQNLRPFFAIVKIHFAESVNSVGAYDQLVEKLRGNSERYSCNYHAFRTVELSDMILAVTADELSELLKFALTLRMYSSVGKVYTYVCVDYELIKDKNWKPSQRDQIDLLSMRFSVTDFVQAKNTIKCIEKILKQEQVFSVTGVDDIIVNWQKLDTSRLVELYRSWFWDHNSTERLSGKCFAEVTTRVGIFMENMGNVDDVVDNDEPCCKTLEMKCKKLYDRCKSIRFRATRQNLIHNWIEPLCSLTNTLVRISKTSVLDEFVYIMYAGVDAFLKNVEWRIVHGWELNTVHCRDFVENWAHLMEHIMRIEGQLTHNPQIRPILYDIPVAMLEYVLSFLSRVSAILQMKDTFNKKDVCFLLVPRLCDRIEAQELFPAVNNSLPGLVLVTIPLQMLYDAKTIQQELSHEVSHFVGEKYRNREDRVKKYIQAASALMSRVIFGVVNHALIRALQFELNNDMCNINEANIVDMQKKVMEYIERLYKKPDEYLRFFRRVLEENKELVPLRLNPSDTFITEDKIYKFDALLKDLSILFREIYADICMLYLLPVNGVEYTASIIQDLLSEKDMKKRCYEQISIRVYVGLKAVGHPIPQQYIFSLDEKLGKEIEKIDACIQNVREDNDRLIPISSIRFLFLYAESCFKKLCEEPQPKLEEIRKMYDNVISTQMDYKRFIKDINQYRVKVME